MTQQTIVRRFRMGFVYVDAEREADDVLYAVGVQFYEAKTLATEGKSQ